MPNTPNCFVQQLMPISGFMANGTSFPEIIPDIHGEMKTNFCAARHNRHAGTTIVRYTGPEVSSVGWLKVPRL